MSELSGQPDPAPTAADAAEPSAGRGAYIPARWIPAPSTVSKEAQAFLANPPSMGGEFSTDLPDKAAWRAYIAAGNARTTAFLKKNLDICPATIKERHLGSICIREVVPDNLDPNHEQRAIYYLHGGGYIHGEGISGAYMALTLATATAMRIFVIDYRMPPDHPYPAGQDDVIEGYRDMLRRYAPENIVFAGGSAGGGLAAATLLRMRDIGLPLPRCCVLASPEADLTETGDSFETNDTVDVVLKHRLSKSVALYADGHDLRDPYLSAVFGDFTKGYPPTILTTGTRDLFLSNSVRIHRKMMRADLECELHVFEAMPHGGFFGAPEDREVVEQQARFIAKQFARPGSPHDR